MLVKKNLIFLIKKYAYVIVKSQHLEHLENKT